MKCIVLFITFLLTSSNLVFAQDIEIRLPAAGGHLMMPKYFDAVDRTCAELKKVKYTKGKIFCSSSPKKLTKAEIQILADESKARVIAVSALFKGHKEYSAGWNVNKSKKDYKGDLHVISKLVKNYITVIENRRSLEEMLLVTAARGKEGIELTNKFEYRDPKTGKTLSFDEAREVARKDKSRLGNFWKASLNVAVVLGIGQVWYWTNQEFNSVDWEYEFDWVSYRQKLLTFEAVKMDSNNFDTNAVSHPFAGFFYFTGARTLGFSFLESFLFSFTGSLIWEYVGEFKEKVSINDIVVTPVAGSVMGEVAFRLSEFLLKSGGSFMKTALGILVDPFGAINRLLYTGFPKRSNNLDRFGFDANQFHKFQFYYGQTLKEGYAYLKLNTAIYDIKNYLSAGESSKVFKGGDITIMELEALFGKEEMKRIRALFEVSIAGIQKQKIVDTAAGKKGYSVLIGLQTGYNYQKQSFKDFKDNVAVANVIGAMVELHLFYKGIHFSTRTSVNADFSQVNSVAIENARANATLDTSKSVLDAKKYYFAFGFTARNRTSIEYKNFKLSGGVDYNYMDSIEGADRMQEEVVDDYDLVDHRVKVDSSLEYKFLETIILGLGYTYTGATGVAKGVSSNQNEHYFYGNVGIEF